MDSREKVLNRRSFAQMEKNRIAIPIGLESCSRRLSSDSPTWIIIIITHVARIGNGSEIGVGGKSREDYYETSVTFSGAKSGIAGGNHFRIA